MINEISSIATMPSSGYSQSDISEGRKLLKALLNSADTKHSQKDSEELGKVISKADKNKPLDSSISYTSLSEKIQQLLDDDNLDVKFDKDRETQIMVLKLIDKETKDTIKQFPAEITIKIAKMVAFLTEHGTITDATV